MTYKEFQEIESYMLSQMNDSAHDMHHVYRVLNSALDIANHVNIEDIATHVASLVDYDVLLAACLLHDIGREKQFADLELCHAQIGGEMAYDYLLTQKWPESRALHVKECIAAHRYRGGNEPQSIEAKILYDSDKLEASGAIGIARTLIYGGQVTEPLYVLDDNGDIFADGGGAEISSFMQEYNYKLKNVYKTFYTERAKEIAAERQKIASAFYESLHAEITQNYQLGIKKHKYLFNENNI